MSTIQGAPLESVSSRELLARLQTLVSQSQRADAELIAHLGEVDVRRLYLEEAFPTMFEYCVRGLHMEEGVAFNRIHVARAARRHPELLEALRAGELHLTGLRLLAPLVTEENCRDWIREARHRSVTEIRRLIADRQPKPDVEASMRRQRTFASAEPKAGPRPLARIALSGTGVAPAPEERPRSEPLGGGRYSVKFTADKECYETLNQLRALLRHEIPDGDLAKILKRAAAELLVKTRKRKFAELAGGREDEEKEPREVKAAATGKPVSRHIPNAIQRAVWSRDEGCCSFVSSSGRRCASRDFVEFDHLDPWALSRSHSIDGIALRCRAHNQAAAREVFGERHVDPFLNQRPETCRVPDPDQVTREA